MPYLLFYEILPEPTTTENPIHHSISPSDTPLHLSPSDEPLYLSPRVTPPPPLHHSPIDVSAFIADCKSRIHISEDPNSGISLENLDMLMENSDKASRVRSVFIHQNPPSIPDEDTYIRLKRLQEETINFLRTLPVLRTVPILDAFYTQNYWLVNGACKMSLVLNVIVVYAMQKKDILIVSGTDASLDEMLSMLHSEHPGLQFIRLGYLDKMSKNMILFSEDVLIQYDSEKESGTEDYANFVSSFLSNFTWSTLLYLFDKVTIRRTP